MRDEKKENIALAAGFVSILLVIVITLFRSDLFENKNTDSNSLSSQSSSKDDTQNLPTISSNDLQKKILQDKNDFVMLDIRSFENYAAEHIVDAVNIPLDEFPVDQKVDAHKQIILIGSSTDDGDLKSAYDKLKDENFANLKILAGGMDSWKSLIGATVTYGNPKSFVDQTKVSYTDPEQVNEAIKAKVPMFIVDVRSPEDFAKGHVPGAINVPFDNLEKKRNDIKEKRVVVFGINELQEFQAGVQMYDMLLVQPFVVRGAMTKWQEKAFPLTQ